MPVAGYGITWSIATLQQIDKSLTEQTVSSFQLPTGLMFGGADTIMMEVYNESGEQSAMYAFVDEFNALGRGLSKPGWYDYAPISGWYASDADYMGDEIIPFGHGVIITSMEGDCDMTIAGQVVQEEKTYTLYGYGITWIGNATPKNLKLKDFAIPTDLMFGGADTITLEIWDSTGSRVGMYAFVDEFNATGRGLSAPGWYDYEPISGWYATDADLMNDVEIPSGKLVIITSMESETTLTLPNPMM